MNLIVKSITRTFVMLNNMTGNENNSSTNTLITSYGDSLSHQSASNYHTYCKSLQKNQVWSDATIGVALVSLLLTLNKFRTLF